MKESKVENLMGYKERLVGLEFENPVISDNGNPPDFKTMQKIWREFSKNGWNITLDKTLGVINCVDKEFKGFGAVNLSSDMGAAVFEMALPPTQNLHQSRKLFDVLIKEVVQIICHHKLYLAGLGIFPGKIFEIEKLRIKSSLIIAHEKMGGSNHFNTGVVSAVCAHQAGVSARMDEIIRIFNELHKITGLIIAVCGNSAIHNWEILPFKEWRILTWDFRFLSENKKFQKIGGFPPRPFTSLADLYRYYWDLPSMLLPPVREQGWIIPDKKINYLKFFGGGKIVGRDLSGNKVEISPLPRDINFSTLMMFPFVKPHIVINPEKIIIEEFLKNLKNNSLEKYLNGKIVNCYIEYRGAAASPAGEELGLPALILGLVNNLKKLEEFTKNYTWRAWRALVYDAAVKGLKSNIGNKPVTELIEEIIDIAEDGLKKRKRKEEIYLNVLRDRLNKKENPSDKAIKIFNSSKKEFLKYIKYR